MFGVFVFLAGIWICALLVPWAIKAWRVNEAKEAARDKTIEEWLKQRYKEERFFRKPVNGRSAEEVLKLIGDADPHVIKIAR